MFALSDHGIDQHPLCQALQDDESGALVVFEGHVRLFNDGRTVLRLEYEAAPELAANEFARIEAEAVARFAIRAVRCVHRVGTLEIGDKAVWIAVLAAHRGPAFEACRYVIDELKSRLPIWKKEHYADGDSGWINLP